MRSGLFFIILLVTLSSCEINGYRTIRGNGRVISQSRSVSSFSGLSLTGAIDAVITQGATETLRIEAEENILEYIEVSNDGDRLRIAIKRGYNIRSKKGIRVYITGPSFESISIAGSGDVRSKGKLTSNGLDLDIAGSGSVVMEIDAPVVRAEISGSGSVKIAGLTQNFESEINGSGEVYAYNLLSENTKVSIAGSGDAEVYASKNLNVSIAGSGDVGYKGNPVVKKSVAGSGSVHKAD